MSFVERFDLLCPPRASDFHEVGEPRARHLPLYHLQTERRRSNDQHETVPASPGIDQEVRGSCRLFTAAAMLRRRCAAVSRNRQSERSWRRSCAFDGARGRAKCGCSAAFLASHQFTITRPPSGVVRPSHADGETSSSRWNGGVRRVGIEAIGLADDDPAFI